MIRGGPSTLSGGQDEVFASRLMDTDSMGRTLLSARTREGLRSNESWVKNSFVGFFHCRKRLLRREEKRSETRQRAEKTSGPVTNDSQVNRMTKLRRTAHDIQHLPWVRVGFMVAHVPVARRLLSFYKIPP